MALIDSEETLEHAIREMEIRQREETRNLRLAFDKAYESIKPINLLKDSLEEAGEAAPGEASTLQSVLGMGAGYLAKRLLIRGTPNPFKGVLGNAIQFGLYNLITRNPKVKETITHYIDKIMNAIEKKEGET